MWRSIAKVVGVLCLVVALFVGMVTVRHSVQVDKTVTISRNPRPDGSISIFHSNAEIIYACKEDSDCIAVSSNCRPCLDITAINSAERPRYDNEAVKACGEKAASCSSPTQGENGPHPVCTRGACRLVAPIPDKYKTCEKDLDCNVVSTNCQGCGNDQGINRNRVQDYLIMRVHANEMCGRPPGGGSCLMRYDPNGPPPVVCLNARCEYTLNN